MKSEIDLPQLTEREIAMYDRIDDFIFGKMSKDEEDQFIADCKVDKDLHDRAKSVALLVKIIRNKKK